ncbi:cbb3-type cytochrome c oxidase subunit I [Campylobacter jejuni]|uniref:cbb3-type cytochrome c oxidase subunit I n=1 Tax=Campylobacter jejuni TaxID=197 RepID=UPI0026B0CCBD
MKTFTNTNQGLISGNAGVILANANIENFTNKGTIESTSSDKKNAAIIVGKNGALVQWWYGHNAVAFVFTVGIIAQIYYFLPKESGQPIFSYKLSLFALTDLIERIGPSSVENI